MTKRKFEQSISINAPREQVWQALTEAHRIRQWFGWEWEDFDAEIDMIFVNAVASSNAPERLELNNWVGETDFFELSEDGEETVVRLVHSGVLEEDDSWDDIYDDVYQGWLQFLRQLKHMLENHRNGARKTIHWWRKVADVTVPEVVNSLFANGAAAAPGQQVRLTLGGNTMQASVVEAAGPFEQLLTFALPAMNNALLVALVTTVPSAPGRVSIHLTLNVWDHNPAAVEQLQQQWFAALDSQYPEAEQVADSGEL